MFRAGETASAKALGRNKLFPVADTAKYHKSGAQTAGIRHLTVWRLEVWDQGIAERAPSEAVKDRLSQASLSASRVAGNPWHFWRVEESVPSMPSSSRGVPVWVSVSTFPFYKGTSHMGLAAHSTPV